MSPRLAVVIGIDHYSGGIPALNNAVRDARAIAVALTYHGFRAGDGTLIELLDGAATHDALHELFAVRLPALVGPDHRVIVYFAGHGQALPDDERVLRGFLLPIDATREDRARYLAMDVVRGALAGLPCRHLLVVLDCCSAGAFARPRYRDVIVGDASPPLIRARYEVMQRRRAFQLLASASHDERALDSFEAKAAQDALGDHSPFARAVIEALTPPSVVDRDRDGVITATELYVHARRVFEDVPHLQTPNLWPLEWHDDGEFTFLFGEPRFFVPRALTRDESPYRGLEPFREDDASIFFGRREVARALAERIRASPLVAVVGPSGAGKTSLLRAGVVPLLRAHAIVCGPVRLGPSPLAALGEALATIPAGDPRPIALIVDPLEELVTMRASSDERASLLALLRVATAPTAEDAPPPVAPASLGELRAGQFAACARVLRAIRTRLHLVLAMRSDYAALFADEIASPQAWAHARCVVPPMNRDELRDCIELPAIGRFLVFSPDLSPGGARLVETLLDEVEQMPGGLPLLSVALDEMFRAYVDAGRDDRSLGWDEHCAIGGIDGALRRRAEDVHAFAACAPAEQAARQASLRELMLRLIVSEAGALARRRVRRGALEFADPGETERTRAVLAALIDARLVVADGDVIELAHDSLIHGWPRVLSWIDPARAALLDRLAAAAAEWTAAPGPRKALPLWDDERLVELHALAPGDLRLGTRGLLARLPACTLNRDERAFVAASDRARRRRRTRVRAIVATVGLVLAAAAAYSQWQRATAEEQRAAAEEQRAAAEEQRAAAEEQRAAAEASDRETQRLLAQSYQETGRQLLLEGRAQEAVPYLIAARQKGQAGESIRMLFATATRSLPVIPPLEHREAVRSAAFSPDGTHVVTASEDHTARVWDAATGKPVIPPLEHREAVRSAAFSPDGTRVVTASADHTARVWDAATGKPVIPPLEHREAVWSAAFSPDGTRVVTASADHTARIWDAATGRPLTPSLRHQGAVVSAAFSSDGTRIVTRSDEAPDAVRVWVVAPGEPFALSFLRPGTLNSVAFSLDGTRVVTAGLDHTARIWDAATGKLLAPPLQHQNGLAGAAFSPDGARVVTAGQDHTARVWDATTGKPLTPPLQHQGTVRSAAFSPDGARVATASEDNTARIWDAATGEPLTPAFQHQKIVWSAAFSPDGTRVVTASLDGTARVWDATGKRVATPLQHRGGLWSAAFGPDGTRVVTASSDHTAHVWDAATGRLLTPPLQHQRDVVHAAFSPDGTRVVTASTDRTARVWDAATGRSLTPPLQHQDDVAHAAFSPDGTRVVTASTDHTARVWDAATGKPLAPPLQHQGSVDHAMFSPDSTRVVTAGGQDKTARIWDAATGKLLIPPLQHQGRVVHAAFSPDGKRVVTASWDDTARIWDVATGKSLTPPLRHHGEVRSAVFSSDGTRVVTASVDHTARVWVVATGRPLAPPLEHQNVVLRAAFSPDGTRIVTASVDHTARVWDAATSKLLARPLEHQGDVRSAAFSSDGTRIVTASHDQIAYLWETRLDETAPAAWPALAERSPFVLSGGVHMLRASLTRRDGAN